MRLGPLRGDAERPERFAFPTDMSRYRTLPEVLDF